jgi:hypothetical protein
MSVPNIIKACDVVSSTYSARTVGDSIFQYIPELDYETAMKLGAKAVKGYGECLCSLHNELEIKDDYSIGYCQGDQFIECKGKEGAFCGREVERCGVFQPSCPKNLF